MSKLHEKLLQFEKVKKKSKAPRYIIVAIIVLIILILVIVNHRTITDTLGITKSEKEKEAEKIEERLDMYKEYDREAGLVRPEFNNLFPIQTKNGLKIEGTKIETSKKGYTLTLSISKTSYTDLNVKIESIFIDGYDTNVSGDSIKVENEPKEYEYVIPKSQLDLLGIIDFNEIQLYIKEEFPKTNDNYLGMQKSVQKLVVKGTDKVDNSIKDKLSIDDRGYVKMYYYKVDEDKDNNYIYFYFEEKSPDKLLFKHDISLNKLMINGKVYDASFKTTLNPYSKKIDYITIPKKDIKQIEDISVSFIIKNWKETIDKKQEEELKKPIAIYLSNQKDFEIKKES